MDRDQLVRLCRSIARVCGVEVVDPLNNSNQKGGLPRNVTIVRTLEFGTVTTIVELWEQLGIGKTLRALIEEKKYQPEHEKALLAMAANRLCAPESRLDVWDRWLERVYATMRRS